MAAYFAHVQRGIADALGEARADGDLGEGVDPDELARASQDPGQMDRAVRGAIALLEAAAKG